MDTMGIETRHVSRPWIGHQDGPIDLLLALQPTARYLCEDGNPHIQLSDLPNWVERTQERIADVTSGDIEVE